MCTLISTHPFRNCHPDKQSIAAFTALGRNGLLIILAPSLTLFYRRLPFLSMALTSFIMCDCKIPWVFFCTPCPLYFDNLLGFCKIRHIARLALQFRSLP
ncbi:hypothetical protein CLU79DRAFT_783430 [Phycomyces nitens]|nr:hypothetical protein CLU79DRAFT_783430 [Phycomyces nitens]